MPSAQGEGTPHLASTNSTASSNSTASGARWLIDALHAERASADRQRLSSLMVAADVPRQRSGSQASTSWTAASQ